MSEKKGVSEALKSAIKLFEEFSEDFCKKFKDIENLSEKEKKEVRQEVESTLKIEYRRLKKGLKAGDIKIFEDFFYNYLYGYSKKEWKHGDPNFNIDDRINELLFDEPFYCAFSRWIKKIPSIGLGTYAGVAVDGKRLRYLLVYEPRKMSVLEKEKARLVIMHEYEHILRHHITSRIKAYAHIGENIENDSVFRKKWNIATDLSINCWLKDSLKGSSFDGLFPGEEMFKDFPPYESADWYFTKMPQEIVDKFCDGIKFVFGHGKWGNQKDLGPLERELLERKMRQGTLDAVREAETRGWGTISDKRKKEIYADLYPKVDWKKLLKQFIGNVERLFSNSTYRKINRRIEDYPGKSKRRVGNIAISVDQSGSVSDELLGKFFAEIISLAKNTKITFIPFDHQVFEEYVKVWEKGCKMNPARELCGGTSFDAPTNYVNEHLSPRFDAHFILTDMDAPAPGPSRCPRVWITDERGSTNGYHKPTNERVIVIE